MKHIRLLIKIFDKDNNENILFEVIKWYDMI